jgi:hypothetical protein
MAGFGVVGTGLGGTGGAASDGIVVELGASVGAEYCPELIEP